MNLMNSLKAAVVFLKCTLSTLIFNAVCYILIEKH